MKNKNVKSTIIGASNCDDVIVAIGLIQTMGIKVKKVKNKHIISPKKVRK